MLTVLSRITSWFSSGHYAEAVYSQTKPASTEIFKLANLPWLFPGCKHVFIYPTAVWFGDKRIRTLTCKLSPTIGC